MTETLSGVNVKDIMVRDIVSLSPLISIDDALNAYFLRYGYGGFPVLEGEKFLGIVTLKEIKDVPRENWSRVKVSDVFVPHNTRWEVASEEDVMKELELMITEDKGRIAVTKNEGIIGRITRKGIARYVRIKGK
ncbi:MAG: CBS domain-containing protein [Desulfobacteraceae bacterium]|nr:CBS domain-containing protein [Pseudomonadota bacterium]MBU4463961.1 CBS domain-containing protein [Pseudomonadota bacterium]MCG2755550.1 CBS domain-containing protein [Desulfobacteraceae bacterium]